MSQINQPKMTNSFQPADGPRRAYSLNLCFMTRNDRHTSLPVAGLLAFAMLAATALPAAAALSDWATNEGGRMRLVALSPQADGSLRAALQIEPLPGWITYWREPGEGGIPPQLSLAPEANVAIERIGYPVPKTILAGSVREIGYDGPVTLPIDLRIADPAKPAKLDLSAFVGLCKDICIPFQASFSLPLPAQSLFLPEEQAVIAAADAALPGGPAADFALTGHRLSADGKALSLEFTLPEPAGDAPQVYLTGPSGYVFFNQKQPRRDGRNFQTEIAMGRLPAGYDLHGKRWTVLVVDGARAMETPLVFD